MKYKILATADPLSPQQMKIKHLLESLYGLLDDYIELVEDDEFNNEHAQNLLGFATEIVSLTEGTH